MTAAQFVTIPAGAAMADYSSQTVIATVCASTYAGAARYTRPTNPHAAKWLTPTERDTLHNAGKAIVLVYESFQTRPLAGYNAGLDDATAAAAFADEIGYPPPGVIMVAVDINTIRAGTAATVNVDVISDYLRGYTDQLTAVSSFRPGVYGDWEAIDAAGPASVLNWQMGARSFSPLGIHPAAHLLQYPEAWVGHGLDRYDGPHSTPGIDSNLCLRPFPAWLPHDTPAPPANPQQEDPDMITEADIWKDTDQPGDKFVLTRDGYFRPVSATELALLGIALTLELGKPVTAADRQALDDVRPQPPAPSQPAPHLTGTWETS